jgi:preprotein translocase subunit SecE
MDAPTTSTAQPFHRRARVFVRSVGMELRRTTWPSKEAVLRLTGVVLVFVIVAATFLGGVDWLAQQALSAWLSL